MIVRAACVLNCTRASVYAPDFACLCLCALFFFSDRELSATHTIHRRAGKCVDGLVGILMITILTRIMKSHRIRVRLMMLIRVVAQTAK